MHLLRDFDYLDAEGTFWIAPKDCICDGASIPMPFWSIIGGPFEGSYRDASVLHDFACCSKMRPWEAVHRMFYTAMRCSGVGLIKGKTMYYAVFAGGPRWKQLNAAVPPECMYSPPAIPASVATAERVYRLIVTRPLTPEETRAIARPFLISEEMDQAKAEAIVASLKEKEPPREIKKLIALSVKLSQRFSEEEVQRIYVWIERDDPSLEEIEERAISTRRQFRSVEPRIFPEVISEPNVIRPTPPESSLE